MAGGTPLCSGGRFQGITNEPVCLFILEVGHFYRVSASSSHQDEPLIYFSEEETLRKIYKSVFMH